jgi:hypothetical protein
MWLHGGGMPARKDVEEVAIAVARIERRLQSLSHDVKRLAEIQERELAKDTGGSGAAGDRRRSGLPGSGRGRAARARTG